MQSESSKADRPKRKRRWFQFSLRTLLVVATVVACLVAMGEVFKGRIGAWLFGRLVIYKTQITPMDCERLKSLLGLELPADATIDWAMFFHTFRGETETAFRTKMSSGEAKAFRQRVAATGTNQRPFKEGASAMSQPVALYALWISAILICFAIQFWRRN